MKVVDSIGYGNPDTLHSMLLFYMLSNLSNCDAIHWYEGNITRLLYPNANMTSQRISDFLKAIGTDENVLCSRKAGSAMYSGTTARIKHSGRQQRPAERYPHAIYAVEQPWRQSGTGGKADLRCPEINRTASVFKAVPGNIVDISTLERVLLT